MTEGGFALVKHHFPDTVEERAYQVNTVDELAPLDRMGIYAEVGTGKTLMATAIALIKRQRRGHRTIVLMPPILIKQWKRWLDSLKGEITSTMYKGTPKQRQALNLNVDFLLMSIQIFKADIEKLTTHYADKRVTLIVDEAVSIKNVASGNFKTVRDFVDG